MIYGRIIKTLSAHKGSGRRNYEHNQYKLCSNAVRDEYCPKDQTAGQP